MTPYSIRCGSCQAKLKVSRPELIGQRVRCPKCDAKVLVLPPEEEAKAHADTLEGLPSSGGEGETLEGFSDFGDVTALLEAEQKKRQPQPKGETTSSPVATVTNKESRPATAVDPQWLDPSAAWTSAETSTRRRWMLGATIAALIAVVGLGAVAVLVNELRKPKPVAMGETPAEESDPQGKVSEPAEAEPETKSDPEGEKEGEPDASPLENTADASASDPSAAETEPETMPPDVDETIESPVTVDPTESPMPASDSETSEQGPMTPSPFESLIGGGEGTTPSAPAGETGEPRPFVGLLEDLSAMGSIMTVSPFERARELADQELRSAYRFRIDPNEVFVERPRPRSVQYDEQLAMPLSEIDLGEISLIDFLDFVSTLTGLSITVEPDAIEATGVDLAAPLTIKSAATDVGTLLTQTLAPLKLAPQRIGDSIEITLASDGMLQTESHGIEGLGSFVRDQVPLLIEVIRAMVSPEAWESVEAVSIEGDAAGLNVTQSPLVQWRVSRFLERWRQISSGSSEGTAAILGPHARREAARDLLQQRISLEHLQPIALGALAQELGKQAGCRILIDWRALESAGWNLDTAVPCNVLDEPLWSALESTLRPAGLAARVLDASTLQITTAEDLLGRPEIEFRSVRGLLETGVTPQELAERLPIVFKAVGTQDPGKRFFFDPETALLITALPAPQQQALARFLTEWERFQRDAPQP